MQVAPARPTLTTTLQTALQTAHRNRIRGLTLSEGEGGVELGGEASSYYGVQLLVRDVRAAGVGIRRNRIRVRPDSAAQPAGRQSPKRHVVLACADHRLAFEAAEVLRADGDAVEVAPDGVTALAVTFRRSPDVLAILGRLPWGGADGVIELLAETGRLSRIAVFYAGPEGELAALPPESIRQLAGVRLTPDGGVGELLDLIQGERVRGCNPPPA